MSDIDRGDVIGHSISAGDLPDYEKPRDKHEIALLVRTLSKHVDFFINFHELSIFA